MRERSELKVGVAILVVAAEKLNDFLPELARLLMVTLGFGAAVLLVGAGLWIELRPWLIRAAENAWAATAVITGTLYIGGWYALMTIRGRRAEAQRTLAMFLVLALIGLAARADTGRAA